MAVCQNRFEEVIASEILTRTWAAVGCSFDRQRGTSALGPFLRSVLVNHSEARHRVLGMLLREEGFSRRDGARLNQLRRRTERWTDLMLGYLAVDFEAEEFAFDPNLVREYSLERDDSSSSVISDPSWQLTLASLRSAYQANLSAESPHAGLNQRIATSVLACFDSDLFDSTGVFQSHWLLRLHHVTDDTLGLIDDLLACEAATDEPFPLGR